MKNLDDVFTAWLVQVIRIWLAHRPRGMAPCARIKGRGRNVKITIGTHGQVLVRSVPRDTATKALDILRKTGEIATGTGVGGWHTRKRLGIGDRPITYPTFDKNGHEVRVTIPE